MGYFDDEEEAKEYAPAWKPEPGDELAGKVIAVDRRNGNYGEYPIITLEQDNGERLAFHGYHSVAKRELEDLDPRAGDYMAIKYVGKGQTKSGAPFHNYKLKKLSSAPRTEESAASATKPF